MYAYVYSVYITGCVLLSLMYMYGCALLNINSVDSHTTLCMSIHLYYFTLIVRTHGFTLSTSTILSRCFIVVVAYVSHVVHHLVWSALSHTLLCMQSEF